MIRYVVEADIQHVLSMMEAVKDDFAGYKENEFLDALRKAVAQKEAFLDEEQGRLAGMVTFSYREKELTFLAVAPEFRKRGIGRRLILRTAECFKDGDILEVVTFREGDRKGIAARKCYHSCGFVDAEEVVVFHYPCQKMKLKVKKETK